MMLEITVNFMEACLCWYLLSGILETRRRFRFRQFAGCVFLTAAIMCIHVWEPGPFMRIATVTGIQVLYAYSCFPGKRMSKIIWGCVCMLSALVSEHIVFRLWDLFGEISIKQRLEPMHGQYQMIILYMIIKYSIVRGMIRFHRKRVVFPAKLQGLLIIIIICTLLLLDQFAYVSIAIDHAGIYDNIVIMSDIVCLLLIIILFSMVWIMIWFAQECQEKNRLLARQREDEYRAKEEESLKETMAELRGWRHDMKHHFQVIRGLIGSGNTEAAICYIDENTVKMDYTGMVTNSGNLVMDTILSNKYREAKRKGIDVSYMIRVKGRFPLNDTEIASLFGNLLDNAIEACGKIENSRYITLWVESIVGQVSIRIENSCDGVYRGGNIIPESRKTEPGHGIGISQVTQIVEHAKGYFEIQQEEKRFVVKLLLPMD